MKCKLLEKLKIKSFSIYWKHYGGFISIVKSPYFLISLIIAIIMTIFGDNCEWSNNTLSILPNLLGFAIGAYAIIFTLGNSDFLKFLAKNDNNGQNLYLSINATFVHFVFVQVVALIYALFFGETNIANKIIIVFFGRLLLIYAILTALASTLALLKMSQWYQNYINNTEQQQK
jgi:flagellar biosynthesis protein FliQ